MQAKHPGLPLFILGHSMGGLITLTADLENPGLFSGVVLSAPLIIGANDNSINRVLGGLGSKLCPTCSLDFTKLDVEDVTISEVDVEIILKYVSLSQVWRNYIRTDPLFYQGGIKFGPAKVLLDATDQVLSRMEEVVSPLLVLHSPEDKVVLFEGSKQLVRRAGSSDKQLVEVTGAGHTLLLDQPARVETIILNWILDRVSGPWLRDPVVRKLTKTTHL